MTLQLKLNNISFLCLLNVIFSLQAQFNFISFIFQHCNKILNLWNAHKGSQRGGLTLTWFVYHAAAFVCLSRADEGLPCKKSGWCKQQALHPMIKASPYSDFHNICTSHHIQEVFYFIKRGLSIVTIKLFIS